MAAERDHIPIGVGADAAAENVEGVESAPVHLPHPAALAASCCCSCFAAGWLWLMGLAQVQVRLSRVEKRVIRIPALRFPAESLKHFKCVFELVWKVGGEQNLARMGLDFLEQKPHQTLIEAACLPGATCSQQGLCLIDQNDRLLGAGRPKGTP